MTDLTPLAQPPRPAIPLRQHLDDEINRLKEALARRLEEQRKIEAEKAPGYTHVLAEIQRQRAAVMGARNVLSELRELIAEGKVSTS